MSVNAFSRSGLKLILGFIVLLTIHFLISYLGIKNESFWLKTTFYVSAIYGIITLILFSEKQVRSWLTVSLNPELMPLVRILYGTLCLISAIQHFSLIPYGIEPYNFLKWGIQTPSFLAYALASIYIISLIFIIIGYKIRLAFIVLFISGGAVIPFSLEIFVKNIFNFYAMFIPTHIWLGINTVKSKKYTGWPLLLMGLSYAILMTSAGVFKIIDPVWQKGLGLYYSLNIPFFAPKYLWWILENKFLMQILNIITLLFELVALPLILFKKTRFLAVLSLVGLGLFLTFIMEGIGIMGGPIVLVGCLAMFALTTYPKNFKRNFFNAIIFNLDKKVLGKNWGAPLWLGVFVFWWTLTGVYTNFYNEARNSLNFSPPKYGNFIVNEKPLLNNKSPISVRLAYLQNIFSSIRPSREWEPVWTLQLFNYHHLFDRVFFRIIFKDQHGNQKELIKFFDEDGAISWEQPLPGNEKFILSAFRMMDELRTLQFNSEGKISNAADKEFMGLILYCKNLDEANNSEFKTATIQIKQIFQPYNYKGDYKPWENSKWLDFYQYNFISKEVKLNTKIPVYDYSKLQIDAFSQGVIKPNF